MNCLTLFVALAALWGCSGPQWNDLFNGKDLSGWDQTGDDAVFSVKDGCIVGTFADSATDVDSYLVSEDVYSDFVLEFDYRIEAGDAGVLFRCHADTSGLPTGYQFEIQDTPERAWDGGIYDADLGWLYPLTYNQEARSAAVYHGWNKGRIEAVGDRLRTFINGVECADLLNDRDARGHIALQIHKTDNASYAGKQVYWKNIRICTDNIQKFVTKDNPAVLQINSIPNSLSERQKADGWQLLFDGKTGKGWRSAKGGPFPEEGWQIVDGTLQVLENGGEESVNGGDIITVDPYENFWLSVDFKITDGANSGIKYFVRPELYPVENASAIGCEYQILDDEKHPDAQLGRRGNRTLASLYDLITSEKEEAWFRKSQWNTAWVKVEGDHVEHWLNGVKVVEYERNTPVFNALVAASKYKGWAGFGNHRTGHILLQEHGNAVSFRNILIKPLPSLLNRDMLEGPDNSIPNTLSKADAKAGWVLLWDGKTSDGWRSVRHEGSPDKGWGIQDGVLTANPEGSQGSGDIITEKTYSDFWFSVDYKLTPGANSGIKYFINPGYYRDPSLGCEYQIIDDELHPDAKLGIAGNRTNASLYDVIASDKSCLSFDKDGWNTAWILVRGNHVEHWLNGVKVVEYDRNCQDFNAVINCSKFRGQKDFGNHESGHILLQNHRDRVHFRNIKIKEL